MKNDFVLLTILLIASLFSSSLASAETCDPGFGWNDDGKCEKCPANKYQPHASPTECIDCPLGSSSNTGATACVVHPRFYLKSGHFADADPNVVRCEPGYSCQGDNRDVIGAGRGPCSGLKYSPGAAVTCSACDGMGLYPHAVEGDVNGANDDCLPCPAGYACPGDGSRTACTGVMYAAGGYGSCARCPAGSILTIENGVNINCKACPSTDYQPEAGKTSCMSCPTGTVGSSSHTECVIAPGKYFQSGSFDDNTAVVTPCEVGFRCVGGDLQHHGQGRTACVGAQYQPHTGRDACKPCYMGSYTSSSGVGNDKCTQCEAGYACSGNEDKELCKGDRFSKAGASTCSKCFSGSYIEVTGARHTACLVCPGGHACTDGEKRECPADTYAQPSSSSCLNCPPGFHSRPGSTSCDSHNEDHNGLSVGGKAGLAIVGLVAVGGLGYGGFILWKRHKAGSYASLLSN